MIGWGESFSGLGDRVSGSVTQVRVQVRVYPSSPLCSHRLSPWRFAPMPLYDNQHSRQSV